MLFHKPGFFLSLTKDDDGDFSLILNFRWAAIREGIYTKFNQSIKYRNSITLKAPVWDSNENNWVEKDDSYLPF
jgi:hypothetical protein